MIFRNFILQYWKVTEYQARQSKRLFNEKGILSFPQPKKGNPISETIKSEVVKFFEDEEYTREMPGWKLQYFDIDIMHALVKEVFSPYPAKFTVAAI